MLSPLIQTGSQLAGRREPVILIVNGERSIRNWIEAMVISSGLRALAFASASELLDCFTVDTAACAVIDVVLPDANGFELQDQLSQAGIAVMFVTRERRTAWCVQAIKAGAVDFLTLPCDAADLVRALRHARCQALTSWSRRERSNELHARYRHLTKREREVFALVASGLLNKQVAERLGISEVTVQIHRGRVTRKMASRSFAELIRMADSLQPVASLHSSSYYRCPRRLTELDDEALSAVL